MHSSAMKSLLLSITYVAIIHYASGLSETSEVMSLFESANGTSNTIAAILPHMASSIKNQEAYQNQTVNTLDRMEITLNIMASALNQVVRVLQDMNECYSRPCQNKGKCANGDDGYTCKCQPGWTGDNCEIDIDECSSSPCTNGGECTNGVNRFTCQCDNGWTGNLCEINIDECSSSPCNNGGQCIDGVNQHSCQCIAGWTGSSCEIDIDECASAPCHNGGQCIDGVNNYTCQCLEGWTGNICDTNIDECASGPCQNEGLCTDGVNRFTCQCASRYSGSFCEIRPYELSIQDPTCEPGNFLCDDGSCIPNNWVCDRLPDCKDGTDEEETICAFCPFMFLCSNGRCTDVRNVCDGTNNCQDNSDEDQICVGMASPSVTGLNKTSATLLWNEPPPELTGTPVRKIKQYAITFTSLDGGESQQVFVPIEDEAYTIIGLEPATTYTIEVNVVIDTERQGELMYGIGIPMLTVTTHIDICSSSPCQNGGQCTDGVSQHTCLCIAGWTGTFCENDIDECASVQCQNGGQCLDGVNNYTCQCLGGWTGNICETNIDECLSAPCQNEGLCIDGINNYTCRCVRGYAGYFCENSATCQPGNFLCDNGRCIPNDWVCDMYPDCESGTDEEETTCASCPYKFLCNNGKCINLENVCDGTNHCQDNSDEDQICVDISSPSVVSLSKISITLQWNEPTPELTGSPQRNITQYVVKVTPQGGGESNIVYVPVEPGQDDTSCILTGLQPDSTYDIQGFVTINTEGQLESDQMYEEIGIPLITATTHVNACVSGPCQNGGQCADDVGNFSCRCVRGYTGRLCENNPTCQPDDFLCDDGSCIPDIYQCDGFADCNDGTDEAEATCGVCPFKFLCTNGRCTDVRNVCDGTNNCEDNSDEDQICVDISAPTAIVLGPSITLQWNALLELTGNPQRYVTQYVVKVTPQGGGDSQVVHVMAKNYTTYTVTGLELSTTYEIEFDVVIDTEGQREQTYDIGIPAIKVYTSYPTCQPDNFLCDNGRCIPNDWVCDAYPDCESGKDEEETTCASCPFKFLCQNGKCVDLENVCDGTNHCQDNSDEAEICVDISSPSVILLSNTSITLQWNESTSELTGSPQRNITQYVVTATPQGGGESKIVYVPVEAGENYTTCIMTGLQPDTTYDIEGFVTISTEGQLESDQMYKEIRMPLITATTHINACVSGPCQNGGQCANDVGKFTCQCVKGYTGRLCENNPTCQPDDFLCDDGSCIPDIYQCDGFQDCNDGTDEEEATCAVCPLKFLCTNGRCTDVRNVCDGTNDCEDNSDENQICVDISTIPAIILGTSITLQWNASLERTGIPPRNITQYVVKITPQGDGDSQVVLVTAFDNATYTVTGLKPATTYDIAVDVVIDTDGQGEQMYDIGIPAIKVNTSVSCADYLGMKNGDIPDGNIQAYRHYSSYYPRYARLHGGNTWLVKSSYGNPWIQADIGYQTAVSGMVTQGSTHGYWVTSFRVSTFSMTTSDPETFVQDIGGSTKVFPGNDNYYSAVTSTFPKPVFARIVRITCLQRHGSYWGIRFEILGCKLD